MPKGFARCKANQAYTTPPHGEGVGGGDSKKALSINCYGATIKKGILMTELEQIIGYTFKKS